ncbi:hypothetical protein BKA66DRAFT_565888 [Pyrenochaeta sp. MPI-SDFR-AT-0127]|nr:hypothetical protein BKA66DRAFT_565888 [Pyrenochaeta sp. MPI-SDFR-AT-0127]
MRSNLQYIFTLLALGSCVHCQISTTWASSRFIGYYVAPDSVEPLLAGNSWVTSASFAGDCSSNGRCDIATDCANGTLYFDNKASVSCTGAQTCVEMTIFAQSPNVLPSAYNYGCRVGWKANTIYRELAATTTSSGSVASSTSSPGPTTPMPTPSSTSVSSTPAPRPSSALPNRAWIAGAVLGPVIAIVLIAVAVIWWRKRRAGGKAGGSRPHELGHEYADFASLRQYHEKDHVVRPVELPSVQQPSELGTYPVR